MLGAACYGARKVETNAGAAVKWLTLKFSRFLIVGGFCILLNLVSLFLLTDKLGFHYLLSCIVTVIAVNYVGYQLNRTFTFGDTRRATIHQDIRGFIRYNLVSIVSFILVMVQMFVFVDVFGMWYIYANILAGISMAFVNFSLHRLITYRDIS